MRAKMKANLLVIDAMISVVQQMLKAPDPAISSAATDELQALAKRRAQLLKQAAQSKPEGGELPQAA